MSSIGRRFLYRVFCIVSLLIAVYLAVELKISGTLDLKMIVVFILFLIVTVWGIIDWTMQNSMIKKQEEELRMYQLYIKPLEELVKDIRARQHEFDNHLNAILNMHITVHDYNELVERQSAYLSGLKRDGDRKFMPLLRISDKVLAGFLYSKIVGAKDYINIEIEVRNREILSGAGEHNLVEVVGTLVDNAFEACTEEQNHVMISLDSVKDKLVFEIRNVFPKQQLSVVSRFFEKGYTTKEEGGGKRGLGLYQARTLVQQSNGELTVRQEEINGLNYICFQVVL